MHFPLAGAFDWMNSSIILFLRMEQGFWSNDSVILVLRDDGRHV